MGEEDNYDRLNSFYSKLWWNLAQFFPEDRALEVNPGEWPELAPAIRRLSAFREEADLRVQLGRQALQPALEGRVRVQYNGPAAKTIGRIKDELKRLENKAKDWEGNFSEQVQEAKCYAEQTIEKIRQFGELGSDISDWQVATQELKEKLAEKTLEFAEEVYPDETLWKD